MSSFSNLGTLMEESEDDEDCNSSCYESSSSLRAIGTTNEESGSSAKYESSSLPSRKQTAKVSPISEDTSELQGDGNGHEQNNNNSHQIADSHPHNHFGFGVTGVSDVRRIRSTSVLHKDNSSPSSPSQRRQSIAVMRMMKDAHSAAMRISLQTQKKYNREEKRESKSSQPPSPSAPSNDKVIKRMESVRSTEVYTEGDDVSSGCMALDDFLDQDAHNFRARMNWRKARRVLYALKVYNILRVAIEETRIYGKMVNSRRLSMIKLRQMRLAQENAAKLTYFQTFIVRAKKLLNQIPILFPDDNWRQEFDIALSILILYNILTVPVSIALFSDYDSSVGMLNYFKYATDFLFFIDVLLNFRTAVLVDEFHIVSRPKMIAYYYLTTWFAFDTFTTLPLELLARPFRHSIRDANVTLGILQFPRTLRILRFGRIYKRIERNMLTMSPGTIRIFRQIFLIMLFTHFMACTLIYVAYLEEKYSSNVSWVMRYEFEMANALTAAQKYLYGFYWAIVTVTTVGYGDFKAETDAEAFVVVICILLGASIYTFTIGNVTYMLQTLDRSNAVYDKKMDEVRFYMASKKVPKQLRQRVINYYKYLWSRHRFFTDFDVIEDLSSSLKADIYSHQARHILLRIPIFEGATEDYLYKISPYLEPLVFSPGDRITSEGEHVKEIFFITQGEVAVKKGNDLATDGSVIALLGEGSFFGEISVLLNEPRSATVVASTFTDCMILEEEYCNRFIISNEEMRDRLMTVAAKRIERMAIWVTDASRDGYVPLSKKAEEADRLMKCLVDKAKIFQKKVEKEKMEDVVSRASMQRTKTIRGPRKTANDIDDSQKKKTADSSKEEIDLSDFLYDVAEEENDITLANFKNKKKVMVKKRSLMLNRDVGVLVNNDDNPASTDRQRFKEKTSALPEPSQSGTFSLGVGGSRARRHSGHVSQFRAPSGGAPKDKLDCIVLKKPPKCISMENVFRDVARKCGMKLPPDVEIPSNLEDVDDSDQKTSVDNIKLLSTMLSDLTKEYITTADVFYVSYPSPSDLLKRYDWPKGFVGSLYLFLFAKQEFELEEQKTDGFKHV